MWGGVSSEHAVGEWVRDNTRAQLEEQLAELRERALGAEKALGEAKAALRAREAEDQSLRRSQILRVDQVRARSPEP